jgi:hypothetical protein
MKEALPPTDSVAQCRLRLEPDDHLQAHILLADALDYQVHAGMGFMGMQGEDISVL